MILNARLGAALLLLFAAAMPTLSAQKITPRQLLDKMYTAITNAKTMSFELYSEERFDGKMEKKTIDFRLCESPKKIYLKNQADGIELLYAQGTNNNKVLINPNGFPWINLSLSLYNDKVRDKNHHLLTTAGYAFTQKLVKKIEEEIKKQKKELDEIFAYKGDIEFEGRSCYKLEMETKDYKWSAYTVPADEDLEKLTLRLNIPEYAVKERNKLSYGTVKAGKVIQIPNAYAQKCVFYIDKQNHLPIVQLLYDDKGLYEKFEYRKMQINPKFAANEWTTECSSYGFKGNKKQ